ncbi:phosphatidylinositol mannoside acyltransferase [Janibacter sp. G56]|uniref:phosphatidylinositol mannoside acyltransferase n=1 Tax=Janibacter sp. G56 TaxID=3418717 RepID=UPI003CFCEB90
MSRLADRVTAGGFRAGWALVRTLPEPVAGALFDRAADVVTRRGGKGVTRMRSNYARVRPELDDAALDALVRDGMRRYLRYFGEAFRLPAMSRAHIDARVRVVGDGPVRAELAAGRPVLCFLGHLGNWDLAGAWGTRALGPVVTVAERLEPEELFRDFLAFREGLGMTILPLTGGGDVFAQLREHLTRPVVLPLLADRDLTDTGIEVDLCGHRAKVAAGPAALAVATGTALFPVSIRHERLERGWGIVITFHEPVTEPADGGAPEGSDPQSGTESGGTDSDRERTRRLTQACVDALGVAITEHTADWHMMQRVFVEDLAPGGRPR